MAIVLVGVGWAGVSAIAELFCKLQIESVIGIDAHASSTTKHLKTLGMTIILWHGNYSVQEGDCIIYSAATKDSIEVITWFAYSKQNTVTPPPMLYAEFLWELSKYFYTLAITGTHGKSTTTGLAACVAIEHIPETSLCIVGAGVTARWWNHCRYNETQSMFIKSCIETITSRKAALVEIKSKQHLFIIEADEFNRHFLMLEPDISIVTSLDHDHVDIYPTREEYRQAFLQFFDNTKSHIYMSKNSAEQCHYTDKKLHLVETNNYNFTTLLGGHNNANASLAHAALEWFAAEQWYTIDTKKISNSIEQRTGISRRGELISIFPHNVHLFSDYGHHPKEIKSTLQAFTEKYPDYTIIVLFEAHQARRLIEFREEFIEALSSAHKRYIVPCYTARETRELVHSFPKSETYTKKATNFKELIELFATEADGEYSDFDAIADILTQQNNSIVVWFSAWILDSKLRLLKKTP